MKFAVSSQWTVVQFLAGLIVFVVFRVIIDNGPRPGRLRTSTDEGSVKLVSDALEEDHRAICEELSKPKVSSSNLCIPHLANDLKKRKISVQWIPHCLTAEQKQKRLDISTLLKEIFDTEDQTFFRRIVTIDETWIRYFEPELKSQSNEWKATGSYRPKKFRRAQSKVKQMMIFAYNYHGVIMTESHVEKVSLECIIVLSCKPFA